MILETDASLVIVGTVFKQLFCDTSLENPVAFFSRALTSTKRNNSVYELKMFAVVRAVEPFQMYLLGSKFMLKTDNAELINQLKLKHNLF